MSDRQLADDEARLDALGRLDVLDTAPEAPFENVVGLVRTVLAVPIATVTLVDRHRQWFKAQRGLQVAETPRSGSFCTHTIQQREPLVVEDARADPRFADSPLVLGSPYLRSYAGVPLSTPDGYNVGSLCAMDTKQRHFSPADVAILKNFANIVTDELQLRLIARHDDLTGALTRRGFVEAVEKEMARFNRYGRPSSIVMLDLDRFKAINDGYGHGAGDQVLRQMGRICGDLLRPSDSWGRLGGEEFALLLPETDAGAALTTAERIRRAIETHRFAISGGRTLAVTASLGVAPLLPGIASAEDWLAAADALLYRAKAEGRNRALLAA